MTLDEAQARGEWLPEGWEWVDDSHERVGRDSFGAWDRKHNILVYLSLPEWRCPYCAGDRWTGSPCSGDFLDEDARKKMHWEWVLKQRDTTTVKIHGYAAPKNVIDMVWNRYMHQTGTAGHEG